METIVRSAVSKLKDLERSMRNDERSFKEDDIENIDRIAEYLNELENDVKKIHEQFEAETIKSSVLRHKYTFYPGEIKLEAQNAIKAARDSNMTVINRLKDELTDILKSIEDGNKKDIEFCNLISQLQPEKDIVIVKHENVISFLNQRLTEKAECQIKLNEIRDALEETKQTTIDLEEDILILREQLVIDRQNARDEKIRLEDEKIETIGLALLQEAKNEDKNRDVIRVLESLKQSEDRLRALFRENERLETTLNELDRSIKEGEQAFTEELNHLDTLRLENSRLVSTDQEIIKNYQTTRTKLIDQTTEINENRGPVELLKRLKAQEDSLRDDLKDIYTQYQRVKSEVDVLNKTVDELKAKVGFQFKEMTSVDSKNKLAYEGLTQMEDTHNLMMDNLTKELEEYRAQLADEREYKLRKQNERNAKLAEIQAFQNDAQAEQASGHKYLTYGKNRFSELSKRMDEIEKHMVHNEHLAIKLATEEEVLKFNYEKMKTKLEEESNELESELNIIESELKMVVTEVDDMKPSFDKLVVDYNQRLKDTETFKKTVYGKKKERIALIDSIKETKEKIVDHAKSRKIVAMQVGIKREESLAKLKKHNSEIKSLENEIFDTGMRLDSVQDENKKFELAIKEYEEQIKELNDKAVHNEHSKDELFGEYAMLQEDLDYGLKSDAVVEAFFEEKDSVLIEKLTKLLEKTEARENTVDSIGQRINRTIGDLTDYLTSLLGMDEKSKIFIPYKPPTKTNNQNADSNPVPFESNFNKAEASSFDGLSTSSILGSEMKE